MIELPFPPSSLSGHTKGHWRTEDVAALRDGYARGLHPKDLVPILGRSRAAIRNRAYKLGITTRDDNWADSELAVLRDAYSAATFRGDVGLAALAESLGRSKVSISRKASSLGLANSRRPVRRKAKVDRRKFKSAADRSAAASLRMKARHLENVHPMAGKTHTPEAREKISRKSRASWAAAPEARKIQQGDRLMAAKIAKYGSITPPRPSASWKAGWREIGGERRFYRSRWEANYARYLQWLVNRGEILDWKYEPETFWFEKIKRGVRSYLPDFRVWENDGTSKLHEVKGWMDARSKTTLKRMAKYHPAEKIIVIRERDYNAIARTVSGLIEGWETSGRSGRW